MLEIVSGERRTSNATFLPDAWESWNQRKSGELLDAAMGEPEGEVLSGLLGGIQIGILCVQHLPEHKPSMSEVVAMLNTSSQLPRPLKPTPNSGPGPGAQSGPSYHGYFAHADVTPRAQAWKLRRSASVYQGEAVAVQEQ